MNATPIHGLIGYYATPEGITSVQKKGAPLKAEGRRGKSAMVKTSHGRLNVFTLLMVTLGRKAASAWAAEYDRRSRAAWLTFRRDHPNDESNHWGPLKDWEADWLADYEQAVAA